MRRLAFWMNAENMVDIHDTTAIERIRMELSIEPQRLRGLRNQFFKHFAGRDTALGEIPQPARDDFAQRVSFHPLALDSRHDSTQDGATKLVFRTSEDHLMESVILRTTTGRTALCVSSQVGCAAACVFCATGRMGIVKNLAPAEILDQVVQANELLRDENRRVRNIVFMGMGEPFHNERNVCAALDRLIDPVYFHHPPRYLLVSTVGLPDAMVRFARRFPGVNLALSLHSARQAVRERLVPLAKHYPADSLLAAIADANRIQRRPLFVEYLMLAGVNDSLADADALIDYLAGLNVHINLIPYNAIDDNSANTLHGTSRPDRDAFARRLKTAGLTTTIRYSLGSDIAAACGQLARRS